MAEPDMQHVTSAVESSALLEDGYFPIDSADLDVTSEVVLTGDMEIDGDVVKSRIPDTASPLCDDDSNTSAIPLLPELHKIVRMMVMYNQLLVHAAILLLECKYLCILVNSGSVVWCENGTHLTL